MSNSPISGPISHYSTSPKLSSSPHHPCRSLDINEGNPGVIGIGGVCGGGSDEQSLVSARRLPLPLPPLPTVAAIGAIAALPTLPLSTRRHRSHSLSLPSGGAEKRKRCEEAMGISSPPLPSIRTTINCNPPPIIINDSMNPSLHPLNTVNIQLNSFRPLTSPPSPPSLPSSSPSFSSENRPNHPLPYDNNNNNSRKYRHCNGDGMEKENRKEGEEEDQMEEEEKLEDGPTQGENHRNIHINNNNNHSEGVTDKRLIIPRTYSHHPHRSILTIKRKSDTFNCRSPSNQSLINDSLINEAEGEDDDGDEGGDDNNEINDRLSYSSPIRDSGSNAAAKMKMIKGSPLYTYSSSDNNINDNLNHHQNNNIITINDNTNNNNGQLYESDDAELLLGFTDGDIDFDSFFLQLAIAEAHRCHPSSSSYSVGSLLISSNKNIIVSSGHSREIIGETHAEECAIMKWAHTWRKWKQNYQGETGGNNNNNNNSKNSNNNSGNNMNRNTSSNSNNKQAENNVQKPIATLPPVVTNSMVNLSDNNNNNPNNNNNNNNSTESVSNGRSLLSMNSAFINASQSPFSSSSSALSLSSSSLSSTSSLPAPPSIVPSSSSSSVSLSSIPSSSITSPTIPSFLPLPPPPLPLITPSSPLPPRRNQSIIDNLGGINGGISTISAFPVPSDFVLYTTMEPCSNRSSIGKRGCAQLIIDAGIKKVVIGTIEPEVFGNTKGNEGIQTLIDGKVEVKIMDARLWQTKCLLMNAHLITLIEEQCQQQEEEQDHHDERDDEEEENGEGQHGEIIDDDIDETIRHDTSTDDNDNNIDNDDDVDTSSGDSLLDADTDGDIENYHSSLRKEPEQQPHPCY